MTNNLATRANWLLSAAALVIVAAGLQAAQVVLLPVAFAAFLGVLVAPVVSALQARGVPRGLGVAVTVLGVLAVFIGLGTMLVGSLQRFVAGLPRFQAQFEQRFADIVPTLDAYGVPVSRQELLELVNPAAAMGIMARMLGQLAGVVSMTFLAVLTLVFILLEATVLPAKLGVVMGQSVTGFGRFGRIATDVKVYMVVKTISSAITGTLVGLAMWALGLEFAMLWGIIAFALNFVPTIGSIVAGVPAVLLAVVQLDFAGAFVVLLVYIAINTTIGNFIEPRILGERLGLSTLVVFLSLLFWGWLWGPGGALLAVPLTMVVKISLQHSERWSWVSVLLAARPPDQPPPDATLAV